MAPPAAPRPEPDRPDLEPDKPARKYRHLRPIDEEPEEVTRHGHGSGCIPVIVIRLSILALLIWLFCLVGGMFLAHRAHEASSPRPVPAVQPAQPPSQAQ